MIDLAIPRALMDEGIERWPILEIDGHPEPLSLQCHPRFRWSRRRRDPRPHFGSWIGPIGILAKEPRR
jgi:hypothetical protein